MTLIECCDQSILHNIAGTLYLNPDKVIVIGEGELLQGTVERIANFLAGRNIQPQIPVESLDIQDMNFNAITQAILDTVNKEPYCVIDITGGDERVIMAVGVALTKVEGEKPDVQKFDLLTDHPIDCDGDGMIIPPNPVHLTVKELVALHGGIVHPNSYQPSAGITPLDLAGFWSFVKDNSSMWNDAQAVLGQFEKRSRDKFEVEIYRSRLGSEIKDFKQKDKVFKNLISILETRGMIQDDSDPQCYRYRYTSAFHRHCTAKAGNVLELKVLLEAKAQVNQDGSPFFDDCLMGVHIDWDGIVHTKEEQAQDPDTRNEMDLILTRGMRSLFISCKNGGVNEDELYKLNTVAHRFGGPHAQKLLIATSLAFDDEKAEKAFQQRTKDMDIHVEADAGSLTSAGWAQLFKDIME